MLPGKKYTPEDFLQILRRRIWLVLVPFAIVAAVTAVGARRLPDFYRSEATILVEPQRISEALVRPTVTARIEDRLQAIQQKVMSRTRLESIIQEFNLYPDERRTGIMEDIVQKMRLQDINVAFVRGDAFQVSYIGRDPRTVMRVAERLGALFIDESLLDRTGLAEGTQEFLESQLADAHRQLLESEKKLEDYKRTHAGELPEMLPSNMQQSLNVQMQIQQTVESLNRDQQSKMLLERQLAESDIDMSAAAPPPATGAESGGPAAGTTQQQLASARTLLASLQARLRDGHPDLEAAKRRVNDLAAKLEAEAQQAPVSVAAALSPADALRLRRRTELRDQISQLETQIVYKQGEEKRLRGIAEDYRRRTEVLPVRESEMIELTRDYSTLQARYLDLLKKKGDSQLSANLERRAHGEQFRVIDPARLPERPFSPDRQQINLFGMAGGLAIGLALVAFLEYRDTSFKTDEEITALLSVPVLAVVPLMRSASDSRRQMFRRWGIGLVCGATVAGCLAVVAYTFVR